MNFDLLQKNEYGSGNMAHFTNTLIRLLGDEEGSNEEVKKRLIKEISKFDLSPYPRVRNLAEYLLLKWILPKNKKTEKEKEEGKGKKQEKNIGKGKKKVAIKKDKIINFV